nr:DUF167 domain-containing protein [Actinopolymorpha pittospori]
MVRTGRRIAVRVKPGARRPRVGGRYEGRNGVALVVAVGAPPVDGRATAAVVSALATAFGVSGADVSLVTGAHSRDKVFDIDAPDVDERLACLLADQDEPLPRSAGGVGPRQDTSDTSDTSDRTDRTARDRARQWG